MKYNYNDMSNISDIVGMQLNYSESFKSTLGETVSTGIEPIVVESMTEPNNTNGGIIHWLSFGGGRGVYLEETQIIDLLNNIELNIVVAEKILTLSSADAPSSVTYEVESGAPSASRGRRVSFRRHFAGGGSSEDGNPENVAAKRTWLNWSSEERERFLLKYRDALDNPGKYYENIGNSWNQLSDNVKEILKISLKRDADEKE